MKIRKFYSQTVRPVDSLKGKTNILGLRKEIEKKEAQELLDKFFIDAENSNAQQVKAQAWTLILKGEQVTVNETCLSSHVFTVDDSRILNKTKA